MPNLSTILGGGGVPTGGLLNFPNGSALRITENGQEFLRTGSVKTYAADYAAAMQKAPVLRVFGNDAKTQNPSYSAGTYPMDGIYYVGGVYVAYQVVSGAVVVPYSASLSAASWPVGGGIGDTSAQPTSPGVQDVVTRLAGNSSYLLVPHATPTTGPWYTTNGAGYVQATGTFTGMTNTTSAICFNNTWAHFNNLNGGNISYCLNANPATGWAVTASTNIGMANCWAAAHNGSLIVHAGQSTSATTGKLATATSVNGAVTDRTATCGITFNALDLVADVVYTGSRFVILIARFRASPTTFIGFEIATSTDGLTYTLSPTANAYDMQPSHGFNGGFGAVTGSRIGAPLCTNGSGTVTCHATASNIDSPRLISTDHGVTWAPAAVYQGKSAALNAPAMSYANGKFLANHSYQPQCCIDLGNDLSVPDLVGFQKATSGSYVRIK